MKVSIMQPNIFMWNGLVKQLCDSDIHIILDHVKASKNARYNRNRICGKGFPCWLTIPILNFSRNNSINSLSLNTSAGSNIKLMNLFEIRYSSSPLYQATKDVLLSTITSDHDNSVITQVYLRFLESLRNIGLPLCRTIFSSDLCRDDPSLINRKGVDLVNTLLNSVSASTYLAAQNTILYAQKGDYALDNVKIQRFSCKNYSQNQSNHTPETFTENLSCLDTLSYLSTRQYLEYLEQSNSWSVS